MKRWESAVEEYPINLCYLLFLRLVSAAGDRLLMYMNWPGGVIVFLGISNKTLSYPAALDPSKTIAERWCFVKSDSKYSRAEMWVNWSTVHWDEPLIVSRAERLFTCLYFISQAKVYVFPTTSIGNKLQGRELWPNILANVVFWKYDCSVRFVLAIILACELSFLFAWC